MHVRQFLDMQNCVTGRSLVSGYLQSLGLRVQTDRIRASISRVDPVNSKLRWAVVILIEGHIQCQALIVFGT